MTTNNAITDLDNSTYESEDQYKVDLADPRQNFDGGWCRAVRNKAIRSGFITVPKGHHPGSFTAEPQTVIPERKSWSHNPGYVGPDEPATVIPERKSWSHNPGHVPPTTDHNTKEGDTK